MLPLSVLVEDEFSDHFPLECVLAFSTNTTYFTFKETYKLKKYDRYGWYINEQDNFRTKFQALFTQFTNGLENLNSNSILDRFEEIFKKAEKNMELYYNSRSSKKLLNEQPEWWDKHCQNWKNEKFRSLRQFRKTNNEGDFTIYKTIRNQFKAKCRQNLEMAQKKNREGLVAIRRDTGAFCRKIKQGSKLKLTSTPIGAEVWHNHFSNLYKTKRARNKENILRNIVINSDSSEVVERLSSDQIFYSLSI